MLRCGVINCIAKVNHKPLTLALTLNLVCHWSQIVAFHCVLKVRLLCWVLKDRLLYCGVLCTKVRSSLCRVLKWDHHCVPQSEIIIVLCTKVRSSVLCCCVLKWDHHCVMSCSLGGAGWRDNTITSDILLNCQHNKCRPMNLTCNGLCPKSVLFQRLISFCAAAPSFWLKTSQPFRNTGGHKVTLTNHNIWDGRTGLPCKVWNWCTNLFQRGPYTRGYHHDLSIIDNIKACVWITSWAGSSLRIVKYPNLYASFT